MPLHFEPNRWESDFFQRPIWRAFFDAESNDAPIDALAQIKLNANQVAEIEQVQAAGFQLVEGEVDFALTLDGQPHALSARLATEADLPQLEALMGDAFQSSRFRAPFYTLAENQRFYQQWIRNAVAGCFDDCCLIIEQKTQLAGAVSLRLVDNDARIGLLAVNAACRGQGIGKQLMDNAIAWAKQQKAQKLFIATQTANQPAIALYQAYGARIASLAYWFYRQR